MISFKRSMIFASLAIALPAAAQQQHSTVAEAGNIAATPGRDVGLAKTKIPPVLQRAAAAPYGSSGTGSCASIHASVSALDDALGPDFGHTTTRKGSRTGTIARVGGQAVADSIIPFRSVVREVSGAAAAQRHLAAAVQAGYARRGYLHGLYGERRCKPAL